MGIALALLVMSVALMLSVLLLVVCVGKVEAWLRDQYSGFYAGVGDPPQFDSFPRPDGLSRDDYVDVGVPDEVIGVHDEFTPHTGWDADATVFSGGGRHLRVVRRWNERSLRDVSADGLEAITPCVRAESLVSSAGVFGLCEGQEVDCDDDDIPPRGA